MAEPVKFRRKQYNFAQTKPNFAKTEPNFAENCLAGSAYYAKLFRLFCETISRSFRRNQFCKTKIKFSLMLDWYNK